MVARTHMPVFFVLADKKKTERVAVDARNAKH